MPCDLIDAVAHATRIINWQKNPRHGEFENVPPQWMWPFYDKIENWFEVLDNKDKDGKTDKMPAADEVNILSNRLVERD